MFIALRLTKRNRDSTLANLGRDFTADNNAGSARAGGYNAYAEYAELSRSIGGGSGKLRIKRGSRTHGQIDSFPQSPAGGVVGIDCQSALHRLIGVLLPASR